MKKTAFEIVKNQDLSGKVFLVTGAYSGLGAITTQALLQAGATVIAAGRNAQAQADFTKRLQQDPSLLFEEHQLDTSNNIDLGSLGSVKDFAHYVLKTYDQIDCLINNAGVMYSPPGTTEEGFETQMGINVIGHFLLSKLLVKITKRQVWLSSKGHTRLGAPRIAIDAITQVGEEDYNTRWRYQQSKLGNILLAKQFAKTYPHLHAVSVHPGLVSTNLGRNLTLSQKLLFMVSNPLTMLSMKQPDEGAATQVLVATVPDTELVNGAYYADCKVTEEAESARNMEDAEKLFAFCDKVTKAYQL